MPVVSDGTIPTNGDLSQTSALHLYYLIGTSDATGLLTLATFDRQIDIHFRKGNPEYVDSNHADDLLTSFLVRAQLATFEQLASADAQKIRFGGELIGALFGLGVLNPATAVTHLTTRACSILFRAFLADSGVFHFEPVDLPANKAMPLGNRWSVLAEQARKVPPMEIRRRMAHLVDNPIMKSGGRLASDQLRLTPQEARALAYFDGVHSLAQLEAAHPNEADVILRVAWMLKDLEAVSFAGVKLAAPQAAPPVVEAEPLLEATVIEAEVVAEPAPPPPPPPAVAPPPPVAAPPKPAAPPGPPKVAAAGPPRPVGSPGARPPPPQLKPAAPAAAAPPPAAPKPPPVAAAKPAAPAVAPATSLDGELRQLEATLKKMREQNFFELFGLTPKAEAGQIKIAYFKLAKLYHPDTVPPGAPDAYAKLKADIFARIGEANRTLTDDSARLDYIADLEAGGTGGDKIDVAQILAAEEQFNKGMLYVKARRYPEAVKILEEAIKGNPEEGEFYAWRGFAKYYTFSDKKAGGAEALKDLAICTKKNPRVAQAYYFHGVIAKSMGDLATAKRMFQKTLELQPDHLDAQRELRLMK
jgi:tetratricopeptide (TPR) repeat protein